MFSFKSWMERIARIFMIAVMLINALAPTAALAAPVQEPNAPASNEENPKSLPEQKPLFFDPPQITYPQQTSPEGDEPPSPVPPKDQVEFTLTAEPAVVPVNGLVKFNVHVLNHSDRVLTSLVFRDSLEAGLEYSQDKTSPVTYDPKKKEVGLTIDSLGVDQEFNFSYSVTVTSSKRNAIKGKIWRHNVELSASKSNLRLKTGAVLAVQLVNANAQSELAPLDPEGGWNSLGRVAIHMEKENVGKNALVMSSPTKIKGKGPALQFNLDVFETSPLAVDSESQPDEQAISLKKESQEKFKAPAFLEINLDGYVDLTNVPAGQEPYVATYDETHKIWVKVPILESDPIANSVTVEAAHFSTWGAGLGDSLPQNGANVLLFDQPYTSLFTGSARYSIPIWTPSGRAGMQPDISLSYSSSTVDGVLGDVQAPWVGVGWNIDDVEIVRKITTDTNGYGYRDQYALTLNGSLYDLVQDEFHANRYYTDKAAFLYIERHNDHTETASPFNTTGEWWEVVTTDGTRYRLGWNNDSEQLALMYGYSCTTVGSSCWPDGAYASLGYAGKAKDLVALRWRVDRVSDPHGNYMEYKYRETPSDSTIAQFDRESYLESISYTGFDDPNDDNDLLPVYQLYFKTSDRASIGDVPTEFNLWDNRDTKYLHEIASCFGNCQLNGQGDITNAIRKYTFGYSLATVPNANGTLTLTSLNVMGGGYMENGIEIPLTKAPTIRFTYQNMDNRLNASKPFKYPRLVTIDNGADGVLTFTYGTDGRGSNSWYNYRVQNVTVDSGMAIVKKQSYTYATPLYTGQGTDPTLGDLIGYTTVTENLLDFLNNDAPVSKTKHTFGTTGLDTGREMETEWQNSSGTILRKSTNTYVTDNTGAPKDDDGKPITGWNYRYLKSTLNYERSGGTLTQTSKTEYYNDPYTGNLLVQSTYLGNSLYRKTYYEYVKNSNPEVYMLDKVSRTMLVDAANQIYSDTRYYYDCDDAAQCSQEDLTRGNVTWTQVLTGDGNQTVDHVTVYDPYGNATLSKTYRSYGTLGIYPTALSWAATTEYDSQMQTYPITVTNALNQSSSTAYLYTLGVPYQTTDPNAWTTSTTYDGLGRTLSITPPGLVGPGTKFTYPSLDGNGRLSAPYSVKMEIWDALANPQPQYRSVWGLYDGAGRMLQTQTQAGNKLLVTSTQFNVQGLTSRQSLPYEVSGTGGTYSYDPGSQFTTTTYDALGRTTSVTTPGDITSQTSYDGLTTTSLDPNGNKISRTSDGLGRLISVAEFSDPNTVYATTTYFYDSADRLIRVKDAEFNTTTITYDWLGRKTGMDDPDMGIWTYGYDALGNMTSQTDARRKELTFVYDALNRLTTKSDGDQNTTDPVYTYGSQAGTIGLRIAMEDESGSSTWTYADHGRIVTETRIIGGEQHKITTQTDWLGRAQSTSYDEDDEVLTYTYDELGRPVQLESEAPNQEKITLVDLAYNTLGQIATQTLGNNTEITNTYEAGTTRLKNRKAVNNSVTLLDLSYLYDLNGNITRLTDKQLNETQFYQYDFLNRLTSAIGANGMPALAPSTPGTYGQQFEYDKIGNIDQINNWGTPPVQQQSQAPSEEFVLASNMDLTDAAGFRNVSGLRADKASLAPVHPHPPVPAETSTPPPVLTGIDDLYTVALLHMNGDDASTAFIDESGKAWTAAGNAQIDTDDFKFKGASGLFDGAGDILSTPDDPAWRLDAGSNANEWTVDFWVKFNVDPETGTQGFVQQYTSVDEFWAVRLSNNTLNFIVRTAAAYSVNISSPWDPAANTWYHVAVVKNGADGYLMFVDGLQIGSAQTDENPIPDFAGTLRVGDYITSGGTHYYLNGWLDELRISKGVARWTTHFTPPSAEYDFDTSQSTATPTPGVDNFYTASLLHMNGADGSPVFGDESGKTWIAAGNTQIDTAESKFGGSAALFDGAGDTLSTLDSPDWRLDGGSNANKWTIDFWVKFNGDPGTGAQGFVQQYTNVNEFWSVYLSNNKLNFIVLSDGAHVILSSPWDPAANTWYHVAVVKNGAAGYLMFVDGLQLGHAQIDEDQLPDFAGMLRVGDFISSAGTHYYLNGWLDELRISKGVARWTTHFTPPSEEYLPGVSQPTPTPTPGVDNIYTASLLHMNGADGSPVFGDESGKTWIAAGDAQLDTADSKFGGSAALFDGAGDTLSTLDSPDWRLDGGSNANKWTIDFWVKFNGDPGTGAQGFVQQYTNVNEFWSVYLSNNKLNFIVLSDGAHVILSSPWDPAANTWYHVAVVKNGAAGYLMFVDGLQLGHAQIDEDQLPDFAGMLRVGDFISSAGTHYYLNGWLDELRISKGVARWTTHFTPPSEEYLPGVSQPTPTPTPGVDNIYTASLLHMNGTDGSPVFGDESGKTWIAAGNTQIDTADSKFGGASGLFNGAGDILSTPDDLAWRLDAGSNANKWTVDFWVKFNVDPGTGTQGFVQQYTNVNEFWSVRLSNNTLNFIVRTAAAYSVNIASPWNPAANTWYHVAVVKNGAAGYLMFVDGAPLGSAQIDGSVIPDFDGTLRLGDYITSGGTHYYLNGWLDEFRIIKGIACWTDTFAPPTAEYLPQQGAQGDLLAHWKFDSTPTPNTVSDESPVDAVDNAVTLQNGAALVPEGASSSAVSFDGTDDFASVANDTEIRRNGSFTLSAWINPSADLIDGTQYIVNKGTSETDFDYGFVVTSTFGTPVPTSPTNVDANGKLIFRVGDLTPNKVIGPILPANTWTLVTGVYDKSKGELRLYINGKPAAIEKVTGTVAMSAADLTFSSATKAYSGKLDEVRLYNRALTDSEIEDLFDEFTIPTPTPTPPPLSPVGTGTYDDAHSIWTYTGAWTAAKATSAANGTVHYTSTVGDTAELTFTGVKFTLMFTKASNRGLIDVYVDGAQITTIDTHSETALYQRTYTSPILSEGTHTVRFVHGGASGTRIDIDQIAIYTPVTPVGPGIYDNADRIWSRSGNAQIDTAQSVLGGASALFDGAGDFLSTLDSPDFHFGSGDFTIDFRVRFNVLPAAGNHSMIFNQADGNNKQSLSLFNSNGTYAWQYVVTEAGTDTVQLSFADSGVIPGAWYHIALVRSGNDWYLFRDGVQLGSPQSDASPVPDVVAFVRIGRDPGNSLYDFNGWLDEFRVSKGIARWIANFDSALPADEYTDLSDIVALLHMNGTDGATTFRNEVDTPWRYSGNWAATTTTGPANSTMHYTSTVNDSAELTFTGVQFTLTFAKASNRGKIDVYVDGTKVDTINAYSATTLWQQTWTSTTYPLGTHTVRFVSAMAGHTIDIDQIQIFDAPAMPVGPGIYDDSDRVWSPTGNAQIDTAQSVFGGASALFDGTGDYLSVPDSSDFYFGTGPFTIDFRVRFNALPASGKYSTLFSQGSGDNKQVLSLFNSTGTYVWQYVATEAGSDTVLLSFADTAPLLVPGAWYHVALVRSGNDWYLFRDGVQQGTLQSDDSAVPDIAGVVYIGHDKSNSLYDFNGWLDEFQISKDVARWTATFTPPTAEYMDTTKVVALLHMNGSDGATTFKNEIATPWRYSGVWRLSKSTGPANGTLHYTDTIGDYAELLFKGVQFTLTFTKASTRGSINVYVDGTKVDTIKAYSATTLYKQTYLSPIFENGEHTVRFVHAGVRQRIDIDSIQIHNVPTTPTTPVDTPVGAGIYDDTHNAWRYSSDWTAWTGTGAANGTLHYTDKVGKFTELTFSGTQFTLTYTKASNRGSIDVYVDSVKIDTINAYNATTRWQQTWTSPTYPAGAHVVRFVHAGASDTKIDIDQIEIIDVPVAIAGPGIYDDSDRIWSPTENAQIDTAQSVFGGASALFDGTGDFLSTLDSPDFHFGGGDFTIDFRVRFNALPAAGNHSMIFSQAADSSNKQSLSLFNSNGTYAWQYTVTEGGSDIVQLSFADSGVTTSVWYHVALVRAGSNWYLFRDGVLQGSSQSDDSAVPDIAAVTQLGRDPGNSLYDFNGWLDEFRVSKGVARWIASFTPPTAEYTDTTNVVTLLHMNGPDDATTFTNGVRTWSYSGVWMLSKGTGPANGTLHTTSLAGSYAELLFNGRQFTLTFTMASDRGVIEIYLDGTRIKTINAYNETSLYRQTYASPVYPAGLHTVRVVYRDTRTQIDIDQIQIDGTAAPLGAGTYDDAHSAWYYSGTWLPGSSSAAYNDAFHYTETAGDYAEVQFSGTQFALIFTKASSRGKTDVYVDGNKITTIDAYSATTLWQQTWTSPVFAAGTHRLRLVYAGSRTCIDVDALRIYDTPVAAAAAEPYDDTAGIWTYTGTWTQPTDSGAYNATLHSSSVLGNAAQVTFHGTQFTLYFTKGNNRGSIDVYVDEVKVTTINANSATTLYQQTYTSPVYLAGNHTVRFVHAGTSGKLIDVDAIQVLNTPPSPSAPPDWQSSEYTYSVDAPHAVAAVNRHTFEDSFTYDKNGNMTCRTESGVTYRQKYNAENRISSIAKIDGDDCDNLQAEIFEAWSYGYDGDGVRVSTAHFTGSSTTPDSFTRYYFGGAYEVTDGAVRKYYSIAGQTVAMRDEDGFKYFLSDHLGSTSVVLDEDGEIIEQQRYLPFGEARVMPPYASITSTDFTYTGQRNLEGTGLMDYKARFYSPTLGRFVQPDSIIPGAANPSSWNRYMYVGNSPCNHNDPDGHCFPACTIAIGAAIGAGISIYTQYKEAKQAGKSFDIDDISWKEVAVGAAVGAAAGLVGAAVIAPAAAAVGGAVTAATGSAVVGLAADLAVGGFMAGTTNAILSNTQRTAVDLIRGKDVTMTTISDNFVENYPEDMFYGALGYGVGKGLGLLGKEVSNKLWSPRDMIGRYHGVGPMLSPNPWQRVTVGTTQTLAAAASKAGVLKIILKGNNSSKQSSQYNSSTNYNPYTSSSGPPISPAPRSNSGLNYNPYDWR